MAIMSIAVFDSKNKKYQTFTHIREEVERLISENIIIINDINKNSDLCIRTIGGIEDFNKYINKGWQEDLSLYDKLILDYNNRTDIVALLQRWPRHNF